MVRGLYTSALGMTAIMQKMDVVSNNIANVDTTGFKKDNTITQSFSEELMKRLDDPDPNSITHSVNVGRMSLGLFVDTIFTDFSVGALQVTDNTYDFAISGDGFFAIGVTDESGTYSEKYSRDGSFTLNNGILVTKEGNTVLGQNGAIQIPEGIASTDDNGNIFVNGEFIDRLKIANFTDPSTLRKYKDNLYSTTDDSVQTAFTGTLQQGALEASNVNSVREMVDMITVNRNYEANQRVITAIDTTLQRAVNDIARRS